MVSTIFNNKAWNQFVKSSLKKLSSGFKVYKGFDFEFRVKGGNGKVLIRKRVFIVIGKILEHNLRAVSYILYDVDTYEVVTMTLKEIKETIKDGHDVKGFTGFTSKDLCSLRLNSYYINIGTAGEKKDGRQYYTVVERMINNEEKRYAIVDCSGKRSELEESELINLMKSGAIIAGVKLDKSNKLRISRRDVKTKNIK